MSPEFIFGFVLMVGVLVLAYHFGANYVLDYRIQSKGIYVRVFRLIPIRIVGVNAILECRTAAARDLLVPRDLSSIFAWRIGNRFAATCVVVRTRHWVMRNIVLTPVNPEQFCEEVKRMAGLRL